MKSYNEFCEHYEYDKASDESRKLYEEYQKQLAIFDNVKPSEDIKISNQYVPDGWGS